MWGEIERGKAYLLTTTPSTYFFFSTVIVGIVKVFLARVLSLQRGGIQLRAERNSKNFQRDAPVDSKGVTIPS